MRSTTSASPHVSAPTGDACRAFKLGEEASGQDQNRGSAEGAGESDHVLVLFSDGAQGQVAPLAEQRAVFAAEAKRALRVT